MDFAAVQTELAARLSTITGLRVFDYEVPTVMGDTAIFGYPEEIDFDQSYARGLDMMTLPLMVVVPNPTQRNARDRLAKYCTGSGDSSIKQALEDETTPATSFACIQVKNISFDGVSIAGVDYAGAMFTTEITGSGA